MRRLAVCFSENSLISILTRLSLLPNISRAKTLASSVLPTPVGPIKIKLPIGRLLLAIPLRLSLIELATFTTASFCPIKYLPICFSRFTSILCSLFCNFSDGIPVIFEVALAISSIVTGNVLRFLLALLYCFFNCKSFVFRSAASLYSSF